LYPGAHVSGTRKDFAAFDKAGLTHPDMARMKQALKDLESNEPGR